MRTDKVQSEDGSGLRSIGPVLDRLHVVVGEAEMMADFVHQHVGHDIAEVSSFSAQ